MTKHPRGLRKTLRRVWTVDGDRGQSAFAFVRKSKVKPGHSIDVQTANQLGSIQYKVVLDKDNKKSLKKTYDPNDHMYGGKTRKTRRNGRKTRRNTRK